PPRRLQPGHRAGPRLDPQAGRARPERSLGGSRRPGHGRRARSAHPRRGELNVGKRSRQRGRTEKLTAPVSHYADAEGNTLELRGSLTPAARTEYARVLSGGLNREDAWQRAAELLFERLAVSWTISGVEMTRQKELLGRYRMASADERRFVRDTLRAHAAEHFPEL